MAHRQFSLSEQEVNQFQGLEDTTQKARELRRLQAVRMYGTGYTVEQIKEITGCSWRSLMDWCRAYRQSGLDGLYSKWQGDNALKLSREQRREVKEKLHQYRPDQVLLPAVRISQGEFWTVSDLKIALQQWYGVSYQSETSYRRLLHECRFSQQQTANQYRSRPNQLVVADFEAQLEKK
jgi:transposase